MKKVLFIGETKYDFSNAQKTGHLQKKFSGLAKEAEIFVLAVGQPAFQKKWGAQFYLFQSKLLMRVWGFWLGLYLCLFKKIDVLVAQSPLLDGWLAFCLKTIFPKKILTIELHGDWEGIFLVKKRRMEKIQKWLVRKIVKMVLRKADKIRVVSLYLQAKAEKIAKTKKFYCFPTFSDLDSFLGEEPGALGNYILFVGVLTKIKGTEYLIETVNQIKSKIQIKLVIVGEGPEKINLENQVKKLNLGDVVEFKGRLSLEQVKEIMKSCYCLVLPSLSEGLPRVVLEAMAMAKPVVACRVGGIPEIVRHKETGFLTEPKNSQDLADKIFALLSDEKMAQEMGQKGREIVKNNYSNARYLENYLAMIQS